MRPCGAARPAVIERCETCCVPQSQASELPLVAFDESGNSGQNLLDPKQPLFVLSAVSLEDNVAAELVRRVGIKEPELKFSELRASEEGRRVVEQLLNDRAISPRSARLSLFHKPWMLAGKFVDLLVEPYFAGRGHNMYVGDMPLNMAHGLYTGAAAALGDERWDELQRAFIETMRRPSTPRRERLTRALRDARAHCRDDAIAVLLDAVLAQDDVIDEVSAGMLKHQLDPAPTGLVEQIGFWSNLLGQHRVVHDEAGAIKDWQQYIEALSDPALEPIELTFGRTKVRYPLQARSIELGVSEEHPAIQIADVLAGAAAAVGLAELGARRSDAFTERLAAGSLPSLVGWRVPG